MRALRLLPLTFLTGIDGFAMFAPYLILLLVTAWAVGRLRAGLPQAEPAVVPG
jgi:hypothetical protein